MSWTRHGANARVAPDAVRASRAPRQSRRHDRGRVAAWCVLVVLLGSGPTNELAQAAELCEDSAAFDDPSRTAAAPKKHRKRQVRPIKMGTSGGNVADFSLDPPFITCCSGTLGALLRKKNLADDYFMLSNNHVLARVNRGEPGEDVSQPGRIDNRCQAPEGNWVGMLTGYKPLKLDGSKNTVDAAIAIANRGVVDESGAIIGIGVPGNVAVKPRVGMPVQKSGRTTGLTKGVVFALNARVQVRYQESCTPDAAIVTAAFTNQLIVVSSTGETFTTSGDSGSSILEDVDTCPGYVGLFFAGSSTISVANKMTTVLKAVKKMQPKGTAELVGCEQTPADSAFAAVGGSRGLDDADVRVARRIQARVEEAVVAIDGVHAMGIGSSSARPGAPAFKVFADTEAAGLRGRLPESIRGIPVEVVHSGPIHAYGSAEACSGRSEGDVRKEPAGSRLLSLQEH